VAVVIAMSALSGCTNFFAPSESDSGGGPVLANCTLIQQATPRLYVCDGKTYTATQLYDMRNGTHPSPIPCQGPGSESSGSSAKSNSACNNAVHYF